MSSTDNVRKAEVLMTLRDKDVFPTGIDTTIVSWNHRTIGKAVILNEKNDIALIGNKVNVLFQLPGGGINEQEPIIDGVKRECLEETGWDIKITGELGVTEDFRARDGKHCMSFGYLAKALSYSAQHLTDDEASIGAYVRWFPLTEAIRLFKLQEEKVKAGEVKFYNTCFNILRDSLFIQRAARLIDQE